MNSFCRFLFFAVPLVLSAENRIFNGSFEVGTEGFVLERILRPDTNADLTFTDPVPEKDPSGNTVLRIDNPFAEKTTLHVREVPVPRGKKQVLRFSAKAEKNMNLFVSARVQYAKGSPIWNRTFRIGPQWKTFELPFSVRPKEDGFCSIAFRNDCEPAALFLDNLSLASEGDSTESADPELAFRLDRSFYYRNDRAKASFALHNPSAKPYAATVRIQLTDDYSGTGTPVAEFPVSVKSGETVSRSFSIPLPRFGSFSLTASAPDLRTSPGSLVVIGRYERGNRPDVRRSFCLGFNGGASYQWNGENPRHIGYQSFGISPDRKFAELAAMGCRLLRSHDDGSNLGNWAAFETESGSFRPERLKRELALYRKHGITALPVLLNSDFPLRTRAWQRATFPESVLRRSRITTASHDRNTKIALPPEDAFRRYVREFVKTGGADFPVIEVFNEPQFLLTSDQYLRYLKIASEEIRALSPETKIVGFCTTSDKGESIGPFLQEGLKAGGAAMVDAVSFHPYKSRRLGSATPADLQIRALSELLAPYPHLTMWNTELYYLHDEPGGFRWPTAPHHIATRLMLDLGEGVESSMPITLPRLRKPSFAPHYQGDGPFVWQWSGNFAACNAFARLLEGAKPIGKHRAADAGVIFYVYERNGSPLAAVWNYLDKKEIYGQFGAFRVLDLFGNPVDGKNLPLKQAPFYLLPGKGMDRKTFLSAIAERPVRMDQPLEISSAARQIGGTLYLRIRNAGKQSLNGWIGASGAVGQESPAAWSLKGGEERLLALPVSPLPGEGKSLTVSALVHQRMVRTEPVLFRNRKAVSGGSWTVGNAARCSVTWEKEDLLFRAFVQDSTPSGNSDSHAPWKQDSIELFVDSDPLNFSSAHPAEYGSSVFRVFLLPHSGKFRLWDRNEREIDGRSCRLEVRKEKNGYSLTFRIPRARFGIGERIGFDCKINDAAAPGETTRSVSWSGSPEAFRNRFIFNIIEKENRP